ncbi:ribose pyranase [Corynebacterium frankenforstense DSM 45800]|uniref:D-ribose pyranase n=1 Tax=Corynebacterium frankenforstense DSM 45800 TaxID=1437875 RepID=A0A1L7CQA6_9CORY|nr:D-ribose pyranase [Corynebacterium frankenforstense]APT88008.1 ribose pyranase [Corynebacterium frankenforstense DSM 45800]
MLKKGILNAPLAGRLARLGHTDTFVIADCGLPVPADVPVIDLAIVFGIPRFVDVLDALTDVLEIEHATIATQAPEEIRAIVPAEVELDEVDHEELKARVADASFVVRTGETTPYANVILRSGVPF